MRGSVSSLSESDVFRFPKLRQSYCIYSKGWPSNKRHLRISIASFQQQCGAHWPLTWLMLNAIMADMFICVIVICIWKREYRPLKLTYCWSFLCYCNEQNIITSDCVIRQQAAVNECRPQTSAALTSRKYNKHCSTLPSETL